MTHNDTIAIYWSVEDVISIRPDLTQTQAAEVLQTAKQTHDATIGINWDVLSYIAAQAFPETSDA